MSPTASNIHLLWVLYGIGFHYAAWVLPSLIFASLRRRFPKASEAPHALGTIAFIWILLFIYHERTLLLRALYAETHYAEPLWDDFGSFAILFLGWRPPFLSLLALAWAARSLSKSGRLPLTKQHAD
jgi:hypothetical protein